MHGCTRRSSRHRWRRFELHPNIRPLVLSAVTLEAVELGNSHRQCGVEVQVGSRSIGSILAHVKSSNQILLGH